MIDDADRIVSALLAATFYRVNRQKIVTESELINTFDRILDKIAESKLQKELTHLWPTAIKFSTLIRAKFFCQAPACGRADALGSQNFFEIAPEDGARALRHTCASRFFP